MLTNSKLYPYQKYKEDLSVLENANRNISNKILSSEINSSRFLFCWQFQMSMELLMGH